MLCASLYYKVVMGRAVCKVCVQVTRRLRGERREETGEKRREETGDRREEGGESRGEERGERRE